MCCWCYGLVKCVLWAMVQQLRCYLTIQLSIKADANFSIDDVVYNLTNVCTARVSKSQPRMYKFIFTLAKILRQAKCGCTTIVARTRLSGLASGS